MEILGIQPTNGKIYKTYLVEEIGDTRIVSFQRATSRLCTIVLRSGTNNVVSFEPRPDRSPPDRGYGREIFME